MPPPTFASASLALASELKPLRRPPSPHPKFVPAHKRHRPAQPQPAKRNPSRRRKKTWHQDPYQPPRLQDLQFQNRLKASRHFPKRFNGRAPHNGGFRTLVSGSRAPGAPLNTTSFLMRAKKSGGIASLLSPVPATPAVLPTPVLSPLTPCRGLVDEANQEWGVNGYGSMNGLIRLKPAESGKEDDDSESDVDQGVHVQSVQQLEQRLDQDLNRFVMTYPAPSAHNEGPNLLETRMDDQDSHIAHLEEENMTLKERLYIMQQEVEDLRRRVQMIESGGLSEEQAETCSERSTADVSCL